MSSNYPLFDPNRNPYPGLNMQLGGAAQPSGALGYGGQGGGAVGPSMGSALNYQPDDRSISNDNAKGAQVLTSDAGTPKDPSNFGGGAPPIRPNEPYPTAPAITPAQRFWMALASSSRRPGLQILGSALSAKSNASITDYQNKMARWKDTEKARMDDAQIQVEQARAGYYQGAERGMSVPVWVKADGDQNTEAQLIYLDRKSPNGMNPPQGYHFVNAPQKPPQSADALEYDDWRKLPGNQGKSPLDYQAEKAGRIEGAKLTEQSKHPELYRQPQPKADHRYSKDADTFTDPNTKQQYERIFDTESGKSEWRKVDAPPGLQRTAPPPRATGKTRPSLADMVGGQTNPTGGPGAATPATSATQRVPPSPKGAGQGPQNAPDQIPTGGPAPPSAAPPAAATPPAAPKRQLDLPTFRAAFQKARGRPPTLQDQVDATQAGVLAPETGRPAQ